MSQSSAWLRRAFVSASAAWAAAIPLAAASSALASPPLAVYLFALTVYAIGGVVCHQLPERSFQLWSRQLPVCARCLGIYAGAATTALVLARVRSRDIHAARRDRWRTARLTAGGAALALNLATLVYEWTTGVTPSNVVRAAAGLTVGAVIAALIVYDVD